MKKSRLLEIIREEIAGALREETNVTTTNAKGENEIYPYNTPADKLEIARLKKDSNIKSIKTTGGQKIKELASRYQLDEETINEMASINQTVKGLKALGDEKKAELVLNVAQKTLNQFKEDPIIKTDRLFKNLKPDEYPNKKERTISYSTEFLKNFKKETGEDFDDLTFNIEARWNKEKPGEEKPFKSPKLAINTTDKEAAAQIFGLEKGQRGRKADPNKSKAEPKTPGVRGRKPMDSKPKSSTTDMDDEDKEAAKSAGSDKTAKELGKISSRKDKIVKDYKDLQPQVQDKIAKAKGGDKEAADWLKNTWTPILKAYNKAQQVKL
jgi:hypothetical protein